jgi:hypothetical protein
LAGVGIDLRFLSFLTESPVWLDLAYFTRIKTQDWLELDELRKDE